MRGSMDIRGLGYIGVDAGDLGDWRAYAELLGARVVDHGDGFAMKIDERPFRVSATRLRTPKSVPRRRGPRGETHSSDLGRTRR